MHTHKTHRDIHERAKARRSFYGERGQIYFRRHADRSTHPSACMILPAHISAYHNHSDSTISGQQVAGGKWETTDE